MASGKCYHHPSQDAVAQCAGCGKGICRDCYDLYGTGMNCLVENQKEGNNYGRIS